MLPSLVPSRHFENPDTSRQIGHILPLMDLNQLYTLIFCLWFLALGVVEYLVLRWVWRRWFSLAD